MMLQGAESSWFPAASWTLGLLAAGFLVSWLSTDVVRLRRGPYILVLAILTGAMTVAYLRSVNIAVADLVVHNAGWGVVAGLVVAVPVSLGIRKVPATHTPGTASLRRLAWEGIAYGIAEGVLLSALPAMIIWHATDSAEWPTAASWAVALLGSLAMIVVHHLGYWDYRNRQVIPVLIGCGLLTVAFLATGSILAPVIGHTAMHLAGIDHGIELPPHVRTPVHAALR